jgi:hypothetical protein
MTDTDDTYEPAPAGLADGDVLIADPIEFYELTNSIAAMVRDGVLFVLCRDTLKWVNVEAIHNKSRAKLATVASTR